MINHSLVLLAMRNRALTVSVATTGATTLGATETGYTRSTGSFVDDGFAVGMEVVPGGFASNPVSVITYVDATTITVMDARTVEAESPGKQLNVGLPMNRGWEGFVLEEDDNLWSLGEEYIPGPVQQVTLGPGGELHNIPIYILKLYAPVGFGSTALYKVADAVLAAFPPRYVLTLADGTVLRVRSGEGPYRSEALPTNEELMVNVYIPLWARTINSI